MRKIPGGSWIKSSHSYNFMNNKLNVKLYDLYGNKKFNSIIATPGRKYYNSNGKLKIHASVYFLILNMNKNIDRYSLLSDALNKLGCSYSRVEAIDGTDMENNNDCKRILKPKEELMGKKLTSIEYGEEWIYDGEIKNSFPGLSHYGHLGYKGLNLSNIKAFEIASKVNDDLRRQTELTTRSPGMLYDWFCILEDDSQMNAITHKKIINFIEDTANVDLDIVLLDARANGWGGTSGVLYNKKIINILLENLHPLSDFSIKNEEKYGMANLWDWKLSTFMKNSDLKFDTLPCVESGEFISTISSETI